MVWCINAAGVPFYDSVPLMSMQQHPVQSLGRRPVLLKICPLPSYLDAAHHMDLLLTHVMFCRSERIIVPLAVSLHRHQAPALVAAQQLLAMVATALNDPYFHESHKAHVGPSPHVAAWPPTQWRCER